MVGQGVSTRLRVGVLMGGRSGEHEVSFNSGRTICDHLDAVLYDIVPLYQTSQGELYILPWSFLHRGKTSDFTHRLAKEAQALSWDDLKNNVDFVFSALHGRYGEDGTLQGLLEVLGIPYLGPDVFSSSLALNKHWLSLLLTAHGIRTPKEFYLDEAWLHEFETVNDLGKLKELMHVHGVAYPCVVKPVGEGSSLGVSVVFNESDLAGAIMRAARADAYIFQAVLVQEKIEGMEFVFTGIEGDYTLLGGEKTNIYQNWFALPLTHIIHKQGTHFFDYEQKYMPGVCSKKTPAECPKHVRDEVELLALKVIKLLGGRTVFRVDGFVTNTNEIIIMDAQPIPNMSPSAFIFHQAATLGITHSQLINHMIKNSLAKQGILMNQEHGKDGKALPTLKKRVAVMLGGASNEREISLESGRNVCYKLSAHKYEVTPLFLNNSLQLYAISQKLLVQNTTRDIEPLLSDEMKVAWSDLPQKFDFVFLGLHGGAGENGVIQGALEMLGVPYNGSGVLASSLCMDKFRTNEFLKMQGFDIPISILISKDDWEDAATFKKISEHVAKLGFPFIVKPHDDGCSVFVYKVENNEQFTSALSEVFASGKSHVMVEEFVKGVELTCGVIGNTLPKAFVPSQPVVQKSILSLEEKFLPGAGENQTPARISSEATLLVRRTLESAYKALGCKGYARIDCFYQDSSVSSTGEARVVILEFNTLPALTPATCLFHQAAEDGIKPMELLDTIIELGFENHSALEKKRIAESGAVI